jgi:signal transduction histidine kinase
MRPILLLLSLSLIATTGFAESRKDSLESRLTTSSVKERALILNLLSDESIFSSPRESFKYASQALVEAKKQKDLEQMATAYLNIGISLRYLGENQAALDSLYKTIGFINDLKNRKLVARILNVIGVVHYQLGHDSMSIDAYNKSLRIRKDINDMEGIADILNNIGNLYNGMGNYDKALSYFFKCLKYDEALKNTKGLSSTYNNIGMVYYNLKDYTKAITFYRKAESIAISLKEPAKIASILNNLGATYLALEKYDEAIRYTRLSNQYYKETDQVLQTQRNNTNLGLIYEYKDQLDSSLYYNKIALTLANKLATPALIAGAHINLSRTYQKKGQLTKALNELQVASNYLNHSENLNIESKLLLGFANIYSSMGHYHKAFDYLAQHLSLRDSVYNLEKAQKVAQVEAQFETEKQAQRIVTLQMDQKLQELNIERSKATVRRLITIVGFITILVGLVVWLYIVKYRTSQKLEQKNKQINEQNEALNEVNLELQQINHQLALSQAKLSEANQTKDMLFGVIAHDMKSPLDHLRTLVYLLRNSKNSNDTAALDSNLVTLDNSLRSVNELLNNLLNWAQVQRDQIHYQESTFNLAEIFNDNIALFEHLINEKKIVVSKNYSSEVCVRSDRNMIDFIVRNLLSNAIKFSSEKGSIVIASEKTATGFSVEVSDHGSGMDSSMAEKLFTAEQIRRRGTHNEKGAGLALQICQEFARQLGGEIKVVTAEGAGAAFTLTVKNEKLSNG